MYEELQDLKDAKKAAIKGSSKDTKAEVMKDSRGSVHEKADRIAVLLNELVEHADDGLDAGESLL